MSGIKYTHLAWSGPEVAQKTSLGVLDLKWLAEQRVLAQIYHTEGKV